MIADVIAVDDACETSVANDSQRIIGSYPPRARSNPHIIQVLSVPNPEALSLPALEAASPPGPGKTQQQAEGQVGSRLRRRQSHRPGCNKDNPPLPPELRRLRKLPLMSRGQEIKCACLPPVLAITRS